MQYFDDVNSFYELWNPKTGLYVRSGILKKNELTGKMEDSGKDPFMRNFPALIDIGIMGNCLNAQKGLCKAGGIDCYQSGSAIKMPNMTAANFEKICKQAAGKTFQIALGGRGDPNAHENFPWLLSIARKYNIVPNYTTSGINLTDEQIAATKHFCGAVAVSWQRASHTTEALDRFIKAGMKTNIHYVLGKHTIDEAIKIMSGEQKLPVGLNAIIFLLYKPVGHGQHERVLDAEQDSQKINEFITLVANNTTGVKIGFDSCTVPMLINSPIFREKISDMSWDSCEAARYSMYITADMQALPCSFDQDKGWTVDLDKYTIQEAWCSDNFNAFRNRFHTSCLGCSTRTDCYGGCPIKQCITLCNRPERLHESTY